LEYQVNVKLRRTVPTTKLYDEKVPQSRVTRDRCYDFLNIFAEKFCEKIRVFAQNKAKLCKNWIIALVFEKNANFSQKIGKNRRKL
jgi:hypothetical protein